MLDLDPTTSKSSFFTGRYLNSTNSTTSSTSNSTAIVFSNQITIIDFDFDGNGAEMGFFFAFSLICVFFLLNQLNGRLFRMKIYIINRDLQLLRFCSPKVSMGVTYFLQGMTWFSILFPVLALGVWTAGIIV